MSNLTAEQRDITRRKPFIEWLESLPKNKVFEGGTQHCALAEFSGQTVGYATYGRCKLLPKWANRFVETFCDRDGKKPLTVRRALNIMRRLP